MKSIAICAITFSYNFRSPLLKTLHWWNTRGTTCSSKCKIVTNSCCLHFANFSTIFSLISCQPTKAAMTHSDVRNGFGFSAKIPPKTLENNFSKKNLKFKTTSSYAFRHTWKGPYSGIMLTFGFHPVAISFFG